MKFNSYNMKTYFKIIFLILLIGWIPFIFAYMMYDNPIVQLILFITGTVIFVIGTLGYILFLFFNKRFWMSQNELDIKIKEYKLLNKLKDKIVQDYLDKIEND